MEWFFVLLLMYAVYARDSVGQMVLGFVMFGAGCVALALLLIALFFVWLADEGLKALSGWVDKRFNALFGGWV
jgi:hypothetical protein